MKRWASQEPRVEVVETTIGDEDEDGVPDNVDRCSGTPAGTVVDEAGCEAPPPPPPSPVETLEEVSLDARGLFRVNSARVTPQGKENLREFADNLGNYEQVNAIVVEGYTDSSGSAAYNLKLARQRAEAVKSVLLETGVDPAIMTVESYGESRPIADNGTGRPRQEPARRAEGKGGQENSVGSRCCLLYPEVHHMWTTKTAHQTRRERVGV